MSYVRDTSIETYHDLVNKGIVGERQAKVYDFITKNPNLSDVEISQGLGYKDPNKIRPRRKELLDIGLIESNGKKVCTYTERTVYCWHIIKDPDIKKILDSKRGKEVFINCPTCNGNGRILRIDKT